MYDVDERVWKIEVKRRRNRWMMRANRVDATE
jgi:hypothetical protein